MKKRKLPDELRKKQKLQAKETIEKVNNAIEELRDEGAKITYPELVKRTGLARSTLDKKHVQELLKEKQVCQYETQEVIQDKLNKDEVIQKLEKEIAKKDKKITKLKRELEDKKQKKERAENQYYNLKDEYEVLLGKWHVLLKKAEMRGIELEEHID